jgi:predicted GIY-YIG superfamily endonuclease
VLDLDRPCALYRQFDADGVLLYVGSTINPKRRWRQHLERSPWAGQVVRTQVEWFGRVMDALAAETQAIIWEKPLHNLRLATTHCPPSSLELEHELVRRRMREASSERQVHLPPEPVHEMIARFAKGG